MKSRKVRGKFQAEITRKHLVRRPNGLMEYEVRTEPIWWKATAKNPIHVRAHRRKINKIARASRRANR